MALPRPKMTPQEYLRFERASEIKHEFYNGDIFAMSGASEEHNVITANIVAALHGQLRQRLCKLYPSDMRVFIPATGLYTYPDVTAVCGTPQFEDKEFDTLLNPTVIIEVLSPSTEKYDRGKKFEHYRSIPSLREYVLIAQDEARIQCFSLQNDFWVFDEAVALDAILTLTSIECTLALSDVYEKVTFEDSAGGTG
jgi:Uma2 family endonuclease